MYRLRNIKYKNILQIDDLEIRDSEITCVLGRSGGGKTTLLKLLNHLYNYEKGSLTFRGKELKEHDPVSLRRKVPMLAQNPAIFPGTIKDNLLLGAEFHGIDIANEELAGILEKVCLEKNLDDDAENLSGGEKQRLALAAILLLEPDTMLLDEPSSSLDEETERFIIEMVVDYIRKRKGTLIMVTHTENIAEEYADRIIRVNNGRITSGEGNKNA